MSVKVKVCGIRTVAAGEVALDAGAWALGFIFHRPSPRFIEPEEAGAIVRSLPPEALTVGVFVDWPLGDLERAIEVSGVRGVQLHGQEDLRYVDSVRGGGVELVIKALRVGPSFSPPQVLDYPGCRILLDAFRPGVPGGTGTTADWTAAGEAARLAPIILAGGIGPDNVLEALRAVRPEGLDVSSGVESSPGMKDLVKIRRLFEVLREGAGGP